MKIGRYYNMLIYTLFLYFQDIDKLPKLNVNVIGYVLFLQSVESQTPADMICIYNCLPACRSTYYNVMICTFLAALCIRKYKC